MNTIPTQRGAPAPPTRPESVQVLGILGGGQLARMLADSALAYGHRVVVLAAQNMAPAAIDGVELIVGDLDDPEVIDMLLARVDYVTIENEFLDLERMRAALARHPKVRFRPGISGVAVAQDKLAQKQLFADLNIPSAPFEVIAVASLNDDVKRLATRFPDGYVLKWSRFGYDGRGNYMVRSPGAEDIDKLRAFCVAGEDAGATIYAEQRIDFVMEPAMISTRVDEGEQAFFPLVISHQERGICRAVKGPATRFGVDPGVEQRAVDVLRRVGSALDMCGSFAVEFFLTDDGQLLVNEMAPRVHNSGHYSLFADEVSQFDLHVEAVMGLPLSRPEPRDIVVMWNLLGPLALAPHKPCAKPKGPPPNGSSLHWYNKDSASPGRKMGHLTGRAQTTTEAEALLDAMRAYETRFWTEFINEEEAA